MVQIYFSVLNRLWITEAIPNRLWVSNGYQFYYNTRIFRRVETQTNGQTDKQRDKLSS